MVHELKYYLYVKEKINLILERIVRMDNFINVT